MAIFNTMSFHGFNVSRCIIPMLVNAIVLYMMFSLIAYSWIEKIDSESMDVVLQSLTSKGNALSSFDPYQRQKQQLQQQLLRSRGGSHGHGHGGKQKMKLKHVTLPRMDSLRIDYEKNHFHISSNQEMNDKVDEIIMKRVQQQLRLPYDLYTPPPTKKSSNNNRTKTTSDNTLLSYDEILQCPNEIRVGYPQTWNIIDILSHWSVDDTNIPKDRSIYQGLCYIDWSQPQQRHVAVKYRQAELPFIIKNHVEIYKTSERWSHYTYLEKLLGTKDSGITYRNEHSLNNHFMYWKLRGGSGSNGDTSSIPKKYQGWKPPTENIELSFPDWYERAIALEMKYNNTDAANANSSTSTTANDEHWYLRLNGEFFGGGGLRGNVGRNDFLYDELPIFNPTIESFFMVDPEDQRGINCRLGMKGVIAEAHYDMSRNFILLLKGQKRYILGHPNQCVNMELYPKNHPSARHSAVNWSNPNDWYDTSRFPNFHNAQMNEVVLQAGDIMYLPTSWFHFIVSLNMNYQCNARCGITYENADEITKCGF